MVFLNLMAVALAGGLFSSFFDKDAVIGRNSYLFNTRDGSFWERMEITISFLWV